jgi:hypothetical protein
MNDPNLFRRRRLEAVLREEAARAPLDPRAAVRRALARVMGDRALLEVGVLDGLAAGLEEELRRRGASPNGDGTWRLPRPPGPTGPTESPDGAA